MSGALDTLLAQGWLAPVDLHLARTLAAVGGEGDPDVLLAAALASRQVRMGDTCVHLGDTELRAHLRDELGRTFPVELPQPARWRERLAASALVSADGEPRPLVLDGDGRLYLYRYWQHEQQIAEQLAARAVFVEDRIDASWLGPRLDALFGERTREIDWQRVAVTVALLRRLCVISGGPGTGKTYTVTKLLALLVELALQRGERLPRIVLLAPTGKAAARLAESIKQAKQQLAIPERVRAAIPEEAATIHRGLGSVAGSGTRFRFNADNPLPADVVLVDEASMVDVGLMARLLAAVPQRARLVLLGDRDQLASVEAGAALGDICNTGHATRHSRALCQRVEQLCGERIDAERSGDAGDDTGIWDSIVQLTKSFRFDPRGGIGALARAINAGDAQLVLDLLQEPSQHEIRLEPAGARGRLPGPLLAQARAHYGAYLQQREPARALAAFNAFRVLCALRRGPLGVEGANSSIERQLALTGAIELDRRFYRGRPVLVTRNDYVQQLFNGDVGITLPDDDAARGERVCFIAPDGSLRSYAPAWLPPHETVFAMTVHKSQGSEFARVAVLLPEQPGPVLSRELVYTAVTRAQVEVVIYGDPSVLGEAVRRRLRRQSGLRQRLWG